MFFWFQKRREYQKNSLKEKDLPKNPMKLFHVWFQLAKKEKILDYESTVLSTTDNNHQPFSRIILLKGYQKEAFLFFTNYESQKGKQINFNNKVSLNFYWPSLEKQIIILGIAQKTSQKISNTYHQKRPRLSQIAITVSKQSQIIENREKLELDFKNQLETFKNKPIIPKPESWGGFLIKPHLIEFWQGRENRLHDRIIYQKKKNWHYYRLSP